MPVREGKYLSVSAKETEESAWLKTRVGPSRVYFLGAGLSAPFGYPVGQRLFLEVVRWSRQVIREKRSRKTSSNNNKIFKAAVANVDDIERALVGIDNLLKNYFGLDIDILKTSESNLENSLGAIGIAEFFSFAQAIADSPNLFREPIRFISSGRQKLERRVSSHQIFNLLSSLTRTYFLYLSINFQRKKFPDDVKSFLTSFDSKKDIVVSFNWDEEVDMFLSTNLPKGGDIDYTFRAWSSVGRKQNNALLLKPHGSIGWYDVRYGISNTGASYIADGDTRVERSKRSIATYYSIELPKDITGEIHHPFECAPVISPPVFSKRFDFEEQRLIWQDVIEVCSLASEFVFLGYSLPPDDFLTRAAIRNALRSRISSEAERIKCLVVGRDPKSIENFQSIFKENLTKGRNFMQWNFGTHDTSFSSELERRIVSAKIV